MHRFTINRNYKYVTCFRCKEKVEYTGKILKAGEIHWHYDEAYQGKHEGSISWNFGGSFCHFDLSFGGGDGNNEIHVSIGIPFLAHFFIRHTLPSWLVNRLPQHYYRLPQWEDGKQVGFVEGHYPEQREISLRIHNWAIWWMLWMNDNEWRSTDPKWRRGSFHLDDFFLGQREYQEEAIGDCLDLHVTMLEGSYPVKVQRRRQTWWRKRWTGWPFRIVRESYSIECETGIPFPGKGENSWDCGDDALHGTAFDVATPEEACELFGQTVIRYRRKNGGRQCAENPWPISPEMG